MVVKLEVQDTLAVDFFGLGEEREQAFAQTYYLYGVSVCSHLKVRILAGCPSNCAESTVEAPEGRHSRHRMEEEVRHTYFMPYLFACNDTLDSSRISSSVCGFSLPTEAPTKNAQIDSKSTNLSRTQDGYDYSYAYYDGSLGIHNKSAFAQS